MVCDDGKNKQSYTLSKPNQALYIPEMIWDEQKYLTEDTILLVLCSEKYDQDEYIHDINEILNYKKDYASNSYLKNKIKQVKI